MNIKVAPALLGLLVSLRRNHQTTLHDANPYLLVDLESGLLQPEAAQLDAGDHPVLYRTVVIHGI
ncbi:MULTISPECIES: hypothetical protein [unclassified Pseudomonas]|uniref:hypothetical protein n=1 Tax=unclassified Pseudomonas TaxID=196821 RepID=UPI00244D1958|nr:MULTISPECIES: hypothetical protein [unclassified Pseudomonas]MDG9927845.1 hypothetical protein [Pseudomonas sp. GD04042]MDH0483056.1 hypothetical protein [Pseudomonas sp. GD04015]MDH0605249.1 hypothetical protein [Pseudomonas sp. GD03869]